MPIIARGFVNQDELAEEIAKATQALDPRDVADVQFTLDTDSYGQPAVFFLVLLRPRATKESRLSKVTEKVRTEFFERLQPYNRWGLQAYYNFTSDAARRRPA
jgi:hypothetical protein